MIEVLLGELTAVEAGALLRPVAADGSPVTGAARRLELAAGPEVAAHFHRLGDLPVGSAVITGAGPLAAEYVVHVVVRSHDQPASASLVRRALENGLRRVGEWGIESVAMPPLGTGAGNLDAEDAAQAMLPVLLAHLGAARRPPRVTIVVENDYELEVFRRAVAAPPAGAAHPSPSD